MPTYLCAAFDSAGVCTSWVEYTPQYILPPLTLQESVFLGVSFWILLLVSWGITSIRNSFIDDK